MFKGFGQIAFFTRFESPIGPIEADPDNSLGIIRVLKFVLFWTPWGQILSTRNKSVDSGECFKAIFQKLRGRMNAATH